MRIILPVLHHIEGHGAVGEEHLAVFHINAGRIGLEARDTGQRLTNHHGKEGRNVSLAGGGNAVGIEGGQGQAAGISHGAEEVEAAEGERPQLMALYQHLKGMIDLGGAGIGLFHIVSHLLSLRGGIRGSLGNFLEQFLHGNLHQFHPQFVGQGHGVGMAGDEPVGRLADDADARAGKLPAAQGDGFQQLYPPAQVLGRAVQHLSLEALLAQVGKNLQGGGQ